MQPDGDRATRGMTVRYTLALSIVALCALAGFLMTDRVIVQHDDILEVVNLSGRQRMLSQRAALLVERLRHAEGPFERAVLAAQLSDTADAFATAHRWLAERAPDLIGKGPLDAEVGAYTAALRAVVAAAPRGLPPAMPEARMVEEMAMGPLLSRLEEAVARFTARGEEVFAKLRRLGFAALLLTLVTLAVEALVVFRPMVERVRRQIAEAARTAELRAAKEAAEAAHHAKSRFLAHAGHDLRQPLEAIGMFVGILDRQADNPRTKALLADLRAAQRSMRAILDAILEISKLESGVVEPRPTVVPVAAILERLVAETRPQAEAKGLDLRFVPCTAEVRTDPALLERILRNFLSNAVRYTVAGRVVVGCRRQGDALSVEVHDTGPGIPAADRDRIFGEFVQLEGPERDRSEGIGLGLAIVDRLARLLGLPVGLRSVEGRGSAFTVRVPLA